MRHMLSAMVILSVVAAPAMAEPVQKEELGKLIREYLNENPEVIIESVELFQKQAKEKSLNKTREAIQELKEELYYSEHDGVIGDKDAKITIVDFFDYNCSACKYAFSPIDVMFEKGLKDVRVVFKEYPIFGERSEKLAKISLAVNALDAEKFYPFHKKMMTHKGTIEVDQAYTYAQEVGIDRDDLEKELSSKKYNEILKEHKMLGDKLDIRGTPFLIVGTEPVPHALNLQGLQSYLDKERQKLK